MASRRFVRQPPAGLCAALDADDGLDPRLAPRTFQGKVSNRKTLQLCRQVERTLAGLLEGDVLRDLMVQSVVPAPDSSRLLAVFTYQGAEATTTPEILAALEAAQARLRSEIALAIHRKKTPELTFQVLRR